MPESFDVYFATPDGCRKWMATVSAEVPRYTLIATEPGRAVVVRDGVEIAPPANFSFVPF